MVIIIIVWTALLYCFLKLYFPQHIPKEFFDLLQNLPVNRLRTVVCGAVGVGLLAYVLYLCIEDQIRLVTLASLIVMIIVSMIVSAHPAKIKWTPVLWGIFLQYVAGFIVLKWGTGSTVFRWTTEQFLRFLSYTSNGTAFVFGFVPTPPNICGVAGTLPFTALPIIIFCSSLCSALYYLGITQWFLRKVVVLLRYTMQTTAAESLNAIASIFLGPGATVMVRTSIPSMTTSEILATMTPGFTLVSTSLFALYVACGACPLYVLAANIMSAPASLAVSKIIYPEVQKTRQKELKTFKFPPSPHRSFLESISTGALEAVPIILAICGNVLVFFALISLFDNIVRFVTVLAGFQNVTFNKLLGYAFFPLAYIMGVSDADDSSRRFDETLRVAQLIGTRTLLNELIAYQQMSDMLLKNQLGSRSQMMAVFACCTFSNVAQIGVNLGYLSALAPERKKIYAKLAVRCFIAANITCFMTTSVAGTIISGYENCMPSTTPLNCAPIG